MVIWPTKICHCPTKLQPWSEHFVRPIFCCTIWLYHLQIKFDFLIRYSFECTFLLSDQNSALVGHMSFQGKKVICSPVYSITVLIHSLWNDTTYILHYLHSLSISIIVHQNFHSHGQMLAFFKRTNIVLLTSMTTEDLFINYSSNW